jgi:hypothetical protein
MNYPYLFSNVKEGSKIEELFIDVLIFRKPEILPPDLNDTLKEF